MPLTPERWQCCITRELLEMAQTGRSDEALEKLLAQLLDAETPRMCANLAKCQPRSCTARRKTRVNQAHDNQFRQTEAVR